MKKALKLTSAIIFGKYQCANPKVKYGVRSSKFIRAPCAQLCSFAETPQPPPPPPPRIWAHIRGRYWSAKIDDIFL